METKEDFASRTIPRKKKVVENKPELGLCSDFLGMLFVALSTRLKEVSRRDLFQIKINIWVFRKFDEISNRKK